MPDTNLLAESRQESPSRRIFMGPDGLRAGWRVLVFIALVAMMVGATIPVQKMLAHRLGTDFSPANVIIGETLGFTIILIATLIMGRFEHRALADYGLPFRLIFRKQFWTGALWGFVMLSFIVAMMTATHAYSVRGLAISPAAAVEYGFLWAIGFLLVGLFEEFAMRGYMQFTLTMGLGFWPAAGITCVLFAASHLGNPGENLVGVIEIVLIALFLCVALRRTGNLWFAIGWHMAFDWGESFFYSTPNSGIHATGHMLNATLMGSKWLSGGSVGPEASVFDLIVTVAGILLLLKIYPDAKYPELREVQEPSAGLTAPVSAEQLMSGIPS
jgi:membrane protease YdiL (CAAX protease family)